VKRALRGTTALVAGNLVAAPAIAADPIALEMRGYYQFMIIVGHRDRDVVGTTGQSYRPDNFKYEGEIWFTGTTKLDNATSVGIRVELEAWSRSAADPSSHRQTDKKYLFAFGDWGRIEFGALDVPSRKMVYSSPSVLLGWGFDDHNFQHYGTGFNASNTAGRQGNILGTTAAHSVGFGGGSSSAFAYYSPRVSGFQMGVSYTPAFSVQAPVATCAHGSGGANIDNCPRNNNYWHNGIDIGANYLNKFDGVTVALYGSWATAGFDRGPVGAGNTPAPSTLGRYKSWAIGAQVGYADVTLGGGMGRDNLGRRGNNATRWYTAALMYEAGRWRFSAGWWGGRNNDGSAVVGTQNAPGKDKLDYFELGATYVLAPGIQLHGGAVYYKGAGQSKSEAADSWAGILGTTLIF